MGASLRPHRFKSNFPGQRKGYHIGMEKNIKIISIAFLAFFVAVLCLLLACFVKYFYDINNYGGAEMADTLLLAFLVISTLYFVAFTIWTFMLYKRRADGKWIFFQLGLISTLGIGVPFVLFLKIVLK